MSRVTTLPLPITTPRPIVTRPQDQPSRPVAPNTEATSKLDNVDTAVLEHLVRTGYEYVVTELNVSKPDGGGDD